MKCRRIAAMLLAAVFVAMTLAGCSKGRLDGTYKAETFGVGASYTFRGKTVEVDVLVLGTVVDTLKGTYTVEDGKITLTFDSGDEENKDKYGGSFDFSEGENSIKIGLIEYTRTDA